MFSEGFRLQVSSRTVRHRVKYCNHYFSDSLRMLTHSHSTKFWTSPDGEHLGMTNVTKMVVSVSERVENMVGKGEIACISNFSFSHNVFKRLLSQTHQKVSLCGNGSSKDPIIFHNILGLCTPLTLFMP